MKGFDPLQMLTAVDYRHFLLFCLQKKGSCIVSCHSGPLVSI